MEKSFIIQMDLDEDKIMSSSNASYEGFVSKERADFLLQHLNTVMEKRAKSNTPFNAGEDFLNFLDEVELTGNDVAYLMFMGYSFIPIITAMKLKILAM